MKKLSLIALLVGVVGAANAVTFSNSLFTSTPVTTSSEIVSGNSIKRTLDNFVLNANLPDGNVVWTFDFNTLGGSDPVPSYTQVKLTVRGTLSGGTGDVVMGTEQIRDTSAVPSTLVGYGLLNTSVTEDAWVRTIVIPFSKPVTVGQVQKDLYFHFLTVTGGGQMTVTEIEQEFTPVPEPASMLALALGGLIVARRRKS